MCFKEYYEHSCKCVSEHLYEFLRAMEWLNHKVGGKLHFNQHEAFFLKSRNCYFNI